MKHYKYGRLINAAPGIASAINYINKKSKLKSTTVQDAIDELVIGRYDLLTEMCYMDTNAHTFTITEPITNYKFLLIRVGRLSVTYNGQNLFRPQAGDVWVEPNELAFFFNGTTNRWAYIQYVIYSSGYSGKGVFAYVGFTNEKNGTCQFTTDGGFIDNTCCIRVYGVR